jgi:flagellum-specific peptidoglycan hydrolase FlgJ
VYAQAYHETGGFTSRIFRENNNLFGMRLPSIRETKATGEQYEHATFKNWWDSIWDYFLRQKEFNISVNEYVQKTVNSGYATDQSYMGKWLKHIKKVPLFLIILPFGLLIAVVVTIVLLIFNKKKK